MLSISRRLKDNRDKNFLIVYILTGHGREDMGKQVVLLNELNEDTGYYHHWEIEEEITQIAKKNPNSYQIAFFACSRQTWTSAINYGGVGNCSHTEANLHYRKIRDAEGAMEREILEAEAHGYKNVI